MAMNRGTLLTRPVNRKSTRLFVIACEGQVTERDYFEGLIETFDLRRVQVKVLDAGTKGLSSPLQVLSRMDDWVKANEDRLKSGDELWLVLDVDQNTQNKHAHNFKRALEKATKAGYTLAVSNPRIELWLVLHLEECPSEDDCQTPKWLEQRISTLAGFNPKHRVDMEALRHGVKDAIERARDLDQTSDALPACPGTRVYLLMEAIRRTETRPTSPPPF